MIELNANTAVMLYLIITIAIILGIWINHHFIAKKRKVVTSDYLLHVCEYCHNPYLADDYKKVTKCPQCKLYNKTRK